MRKLGARLVGKSKIQQLTQVQKVLLFTFATNAVFMMAFPHFIFLHALETLVWALFCLSTWWDFATFILASNEAFGPALNQLGLKNIVGASGEQSGIHSQRQAELVRSARNKIQRGKKNLRTMIVINFVLLHMAYLLYVMAMPFWPINAVKAADNCHPRSHDDVRHLVETVRFYIEDVFHVIIVTSLCANIVFYKYMKNGGRLSQKQKTEGGSHAVAPHVGASNGAFLGFLLLVAASRSHIFSLTASIARASESLFGRRIIPFSNFDPPPSPLLLLLHPSQRKHYG
jgi:cell division protein FtsL